MTEAQLARFLQKVHVSEQSGCWEWTAGRMPNGYGKFKIDGKTRGAHCVAYEHWVGPIPPGLEIDHLCRNRICVLAEHLEAVPHRVNVQRGLVPSVMRVIKKGNLNTLGYKHTDEAKATIGRSHRGKVLSAETRAKISAARTGKRYGPPSDEAREHMAEARRRWWARKKGQGQ